ncbi:MAG: DUF4349 domain-containing protein [Clostridia bacterium]|nr:DUF4349 domain-containing protein [Clostridia bacterium]
MLRRSMLALALAAALLLAGCAGGASLNQEVSYDAAPAAESVEAEAPRAGELSTQAGAGAAQSASGEPDDAGTRKIIYTAYLDLRADDPAAALDAVVRQAQALGGYLAASYTDNDEEGAYYSSATLKVPAASLDTLVGAAKGEGTVESYSLNSDDISLSYYDIQARLSNAEAEEAQLLTLLAACESVEDVLAVREQLTRVRADIESYQAQINLWDNLVDYATLELSVRRTARPAVAGENDLIEIWRASDVWRNIRNGFQNSARGVINAIGAIGIFLAYALIPAAILFLCIGLPIILRRRKKRRAAQQAAAALPSQQNPPLG